MPGYVNCARPLPTSCAAKTTSIISAENIVVSTGAKQALANAVMSLVNPGEEVIILALTG